MRKEFWILLVYVFFSMPYANSQSQPVKVQTLEDKIKVAIVSKESDPQSAIITLNEVISSALKEKKFHIVAKSYSILGDIFVDIEQYDLAVDRYALGLSYVDNNSYDSSNHFPNLKANIYLRMGDTYLKLQAHNPAERSYQRGIAWSKDSSVLMLLHEGLLETQLLKKEYKKFEKQNNYLQDNFRRGDSLTTARQNARLSRYYLEQNKPKEALEYLNNSMINVPQGPQGNLESQGHDGPLRSSRSKWKVGPAGPAGPYGASKSDSVQVLRTYGSSGVIGKKELEPVRTALSDLNNTDNVSNIGKIESQLSVLDLNPFRGNDYHVKDNFTMAELYEAEDDISNAARYLKTSKDLISSETDVNIKAKVFKKSAEYNQRVGRVNTALLDLENYIEAKEEAIAEIERNLQHQVEIVKAQQKLDLDLKELDLEETEALLLSSQIMSQRWIIGLLCLLLVASLAYFYFLYNSIKEKKLANNRLMLSSLNTQMNPHFIFNALNSVNNFISKSDEKSANKYLSDFSSLMRKVLKNSSEEYISLEDEIELIELYLKLEQFRFRDKFDYTFNNNLVTSSKNFRVPPMLVQPFIENAVWHGLRYKEQRGLLTVTINELSAELHIVVSDNGIGRSRSRDQKTKNQKLYKSIGMNNVRKRIELLNEMHDMDFSIKVEDLRPDGKEVGTVVTLTIPKK